MSSKWRAVRGEGGRTELLAIGCGVQGLLLLVIDRKDDVLVMADDGHVSIHVRGIAIEKGRVGDRIHCRLRTSDPRDRTTWFAVEVVGPGRVRLPRD